MQFLRRWSHWWRTSDATIARWSRAAHSALLGEMPILAAGTALFAIIAVVPTLAAAVAVYGLLADPFQIKSGIQELNRIMPAEVVDFIGSQLERQAKRSSGELTLQLVISVVLAVISARGSARALVDALNRAYRVREVRSSWQKFLLSVAMAGGTLIGLMLMFAVLVVVPTIVALFRHTWIPIAMWIRWPVLLTVVFVALLFLYRYAPSPRPLGPLERTEVGGPINLPPRPVRHVCFPGAVIATALLLVVSLALSIWVDKISNTELIYGAFGSVVVTLLWFYMSTMALLIGGFVNAELERRAGAPPPDRSMY